MVDITQLYVLVKIMELYNKMCEFYCGMNFSEWKKRQVDDKVYFTKIIIKGDIL